MHDPPRRSGFMFYKSLKLFIFRNVQPQCTCRCFVFYWKPACCYQPHRQDWSMEFYDTALASMYTNLSSTSSSANSSHVDLYDLYKIVWKGPPGRLFLPSTNHPTHISLSRFSCKQNSCLVHPLLNSHN